MFDKCLWPYSSVGRSYNFMTVFTELCFNVLKMDTVQSAKTNCVSLLKKAIMQNL